MQTPPITSQFPKCPLLPHLNVPRSLSTHWRGWRTRLAGAGLPRISDAGAGLLDSGCLDVGQGPPLLIGNSPRLGVSDGQGLGVVDGQVLLLVGVLQVGGDLVHPGA